MKTHDIIDSYHNLLKSSELIFYLWFATKYPYGALLTEIRAKSYIESRQVLRYFKSIKEAGLVRIEEEGTEYVKYIPTTTRTAAKVTKIPQRSHFQTQLQTGTR
jgi:hypothetical protein